MVPIASMARRTQTFPAFLVLASRVAVCSRKCRWLAGVDLELEDPKAPNAHGGNKQVSRAVNKKKKKDDWSPSIKCVVRIWLLPHCLCCISTVTDRIFVY